jgi:hypothetical protein
MIMRICLYAVSYLVLLSPAAASAQTFPESDPDTIFYTVRGERHGVSFFRQHRHEGVEYEAGDLLTFDRYHTVDVMYQWLQRWAAQYPNLIDVYEVAKSYEGRPIMQVTLTNKETGAAVDKPASYFEGGRHSGEVTSSESALWLIKYLLENYGQDSEVTEFLDTRAMYVRPENNPDGSNMYLHTAQSNRSTVRPHDNDRDGLLDEDSPNDLDGDGVIYEIRYRPRPGTDDEANYIVDDRDPSGRLLRRIRGDEVGEWLVISEGLDDDGDGRYNEDGIGGLDLHRNYPENWRPDVGGDKTRRGYTQGGAGAFPLSEIETRATVLFLLANPNVSVVNSMDTRVPMHLRPPSTSRSSERMYPEDLAYYEMFDQMGMDLTGYPWAGDVYYTYRMRVPVNPFTGDSANPGPLFGHSPDFGYWYYGAIWYGDELWNGGAMEDYNNDGLRDQVDALIWDDQENGGNGFREWEPFHHPALGDVEIGGFHPKFFSQNGPSHELERWASNQALFNFEMSKHLPLIDDVDTRIRVHRGDDSTTYEVTVSWTNSGRLPTALRQAQLVKIVQEDRVRIEFADSLTEGDSPQLQIVTPSRRDKVISSGWTEPGEHKSVTFEVRTYGIPGVEGTVHVMSTRGGLVKVPLVLGQP